MEWIKSIIMIIILIISPIMILISIRRRRKWKLNNLKKEDNNNKRVRRTIGIVVLGDLSRSPRMMRHINSFADHGWNVSVIGYQISQIPKKIIQDPLINLIDLKEFPNWFQVNSFNNNNNNNDNDKNDKNSLFIFGILISVFKTIYLSLSLLFKLFMNFQDCEFILIQNPPAIPTLPIVKCFNLFNDFKLIIDWHNTTYSILALKFKSDRHPIVRLAQWMESKFGKLAHLHLFVTHAEKKYLSENWNLRGKKQVFYDRPPKEFGRLSVKEIHSFLTKCKFNSNEELKQIFYSKPNLPNETLITYQEDFQEPKFKPNRPILVISSTSWTIDEDFMILIDGLSNYVRLKKKIEEEEEDLIKREETTIPKLCCLITGKGPLREHYEKIIKDRSKNERWFEIGVKCDLIWFNQIEDYMFLLGSSDLGISLHQSSSGLDLPMKIIDMFGCGLTVCARNFNCISELVKHDQNGLVFDTAEELANQLIELLKNFNENDYLNKLKDGIQKVKYGIQQEFESDWIDWNQNWEKNVEDLLIGS